MRIAMMGLAACWLAATATAAEPVKKAPPAKVSASQLFLRLDAIDKRLEEMMKAQAFMSSKAPTLQAAAPVAAAAAVAPGEGSVPRDLAQALHDAGVYHKRAQNMKLTATIIRDFTVVAGAIMAAYGYEQTEETMRKPGAPLTSTFSDYNRRSAFRRYTLFSSGATLAGLGLVVGEFIDWTANRAEARAGTALKRPLEMLPTAKP